MKSTYIVVGVGIGVVIGAIAWLTSAPSLVSTTDSTIEKRAGTEKISSGDTPDTLSGKDSLAHLLALGRTLECSFQFNDTTLTGEGTGFFDGEKMRIDSMYPGEGGVTYTSNLIIVGGDMYVWATTDAGTFAVKMPTSAEGSAQSGTAATGQLSPQDTVSYSCKSWNVDGSVFVPPSNLDFMDMSEIIKGMPTLPTPPVSKVETYTMADVASVTLTNVDPIKEAIDDEYVLYSIVLKSGASYQVKTYGMVPAEMNQAEFRKTGYTGDVAALIKLSGSR